MAQSILGSVVATSLHSLAKTLSDNIFTATPFAWWMKENGRIQSYDGGLFIQEDVEMALNSSVGWRSAKAPIPVVEQDPIRAVAFSPVTIDGSVPIYWDDEDNNKHRIMDYSKTLIANLERTLKQKMNQAFFSDGTETNTDGTKGDSLWGLEAIVSASNSYASAMIADSSLPHAFEAMNRSLARYTFWQSTVQSTSEPLSLNAGTDGGLRGLYNACVTGGANLESPDLIVTTKALWSAFEALLIPSRQFENGKLADAGFQSLKFDKAAVVWDPNCPSGTIYALNTNFLKIRPTAECAGNVMFSERRPIDDTMADNIIALWKGQMTCTGPRYLAKQTNKS